MRSADNHKSTKRRAYNNPVVRVVILGFLSVCGHSHFLLPCWCHTQGIDVVSSPLFLCHLLCLSVQTPVCLSVSLSDCLCTRVLIVCVLVQCMEVHHAELQEERVSAGHSPQSA